MRKSSRIVLFAALVLVAVFVAIGDALFHGYFDPGQFEIEQVRWSSSQELAIVAKRSDHQALNGDQYFVLIGKHLFSTRELRRAYYGPDVVFRAKSSCLALRWKNPHNLVVACGDRSIDAGQIAVQRHQVGNVAITYEDIPLVFEK